MKMEHEHSNNPNNSWAIRDSDAEHGCYECPVCFGIMHWKGNDEYICESCGNIAHEEGDGVWFDHDPEDDYEQFYESIPQGCKACGGDYPNCVEGCKLVNEY